jgi:predicted O-methyltransferase YrrM
MPKVTDDEMYGRTALREGLPWIVPESLEHLERVIQADWRVFEWGSGGSTVYWGRNCAHVISVEHNKEWVERTTKLIRKFGVVPRVSLLYVRGDGSGDAKTAFRDYADVILDFPDESFDLVFVDGEASSRGWCLNNAIPKLKHGGYLLLDNSDWLKRDVTDQFERWDYAAHDLEWIGQKGTFSWWTSLLRRRD